METMMLYFHDNVFVVEFNGKVAETEDIKNLMKWMIHDMNIRLGDASSIAKMVMDNPAKGVLLAQTMSLDAGLALLGKLKEAV